MFPKIASALARVLDPIKPIERPGQSLSLTKPADSGEGGHGNPGYDPTADAENEASSPSENDPPRGHLPEELVAAEHPNPRVSAVPFQPGLTQVILDLNAARTDRSASVAVQTYEAGAKDQKKNARLPKGSMLDKKIG